MDELNKILKSAALNLLARRDYSCTELYSRLKNKIAAHHLSYPEASIDVEIDRVIENLQRLDLQSDQRFSESYVRSRQRRGFGEQRIRLELQQKGIDADTVEGVFASSELDVQGEIHKVWKKKYKHLPEDANSRAKQINFLRYRGFFLEDINAFFNSAT